MSFMLAEPGALVSAASDVAGIGSTLSTAHAVAAAPTTGVLAAAADEVSTQIAALFSQHAQSYQQLSARAAVFHEQFVAALAATASNYAAAETAAARTLVNAVSTPAQAVLGHPVGGALSNAVSRVEAAFAGNAGALFGGGSSPFHGINAGALLGRPTGGATAATAVGSLLHAGGLTNAHAIPAAFNSIATAIENFYNYAEPYVQYVFNLAAWAVGWLPWVGILGQQINFLYYLFEPMVQSALFNTLDWLTGTISFSQGLSNFWAATTASINQFIYTEINWVRGFLPPLPPLPPL